MNDEIRRRHLLKRMAEGDADSFEAFYNDFVNVLYGYLKSRVNDDFTVKDIIQETFLAIWKNCRQYTGASKVSTWVIGIARNKMMDALRAKYLKDEDAFAIEDSDIQQFDDFAERLSDEITVQKALESLSDSLKELVYLVFNLGMSYKEISQVLGIPEGTVKSRMHCLKNELRKKLGSGGDSYGRKVQ